MSRKEVILNERNEVYIKTQSGKTFPYSVLSSGEKQLFIFLGEVLLTERKPFVYIADEPELSLHVEWQSRLVDSIFALNKNTQLIFATHSPDIVSHFSEYAIHIEDCVS